MAKQKKPAFLKTFSEFTIEELRSMPVGKVLSLFGEEIQATFTERKPTAKKINKKVISGKTTEVKQRKHLTSDALKTVKRIFSIHQKANASVPTEPVVILKEKGKRSKKKRDSLSEPKEETIVFTSKKDTDDQPMNGMISTQ